MIPKLLYKALTPSGVDEVMSMYRQPHRLYHDAKHIYEMFDVAERLRIDLTLPQQLAILFHDVVYVPGSKYNEEQSVDLMYLYAFKAGIAGHILDAAADIIIDTKTHISDDNESWIVLDLDLYRLAAPHAEFNVHTTEILVENMHLIHADSIEEQRAEFNRLRAEFLINFLKGRDKIYRTDAMSLFEDVARNNISHYLAYN